MEYDLVQVDRKNEKYVLYTDSMHILGKNEIREDVFIKKDKVFLYDAKTNNRVKELTQQEKEDIIKENNNTMIREDYKTEYQTYHKYEYANGKIEFIEPEIPGIKYQENRFNLEPYVIYKGQYITVKEKNTNQQLTELELLNTINQYNQTHAQPGILQPQINKIEDIKIELEVYPGEKYNIKRKSKKMVSEPVVEKDSLGKEKIKYFTLKQIQDEHFYEKELPPTEVKFTNKYFKMIPKSSKLKDILKKYNHPTNYVPIDKLIDILTEEKKEIEEIKDKLAEVINKLNESTYNKEIDYGKIHDKTKKVSQIIDTIFT